MYIIFSFNGEKLRSVQNDRSVVYLIQTCHDIILRSCQFLQKIKKSNVRTFCSRLQTVTKHAVEFWLMFDSRTHQVFEFLFYLKIGYGARLLLTKQRTMILPFLSIYEPISNLQHTLLACWSRIVFKVYTAIL